MGTILRLIVFGAAIVLVIWLLRRALSGASSAKKPPADAPSDLVSCAHCNVNLPRAEARSAGGRFYCSEEHWRLGPRDG